MRFTPKTEKEIQEEGLLPAGPYSFEIFKAEERQSKAGNDMIYLKVGVFDDDGRIHYVDDYLMESISYKLRHAAEVCGLLDDYEQGQLNAGDFVNKTGQCKVGIEKDKNNQYPDKNRIVDYLRPVDAVPAKPISAHNKSKADGYQAAREAQAPIELDDEIPF
jgi:hypothetical protein